MSTIRRFRLTGRSYQVDRRGPFLCIVARVHNSYKGFAKRTRLGQLRPIRVWRTRKSPTGKRYQWE